MADAVSWERVAIMAAPLPDTPRRVGRQNPSRSRPRTSSSKPRMTAAVSAEATDIMQAPSATLLAWRGARKR